MAETDNQAGSTAEAQANVAEAEKNKRVEAAQQATETAEAEGRLPETMAVTNPAPATEMEAGSGAFVEPEIKAAVPTDHPAVENNPRAGTSAIQNGGDFNDPRHLTPNDPGFAGQGLDLSVYGTAPAAGEAPEAAGSKKRKKD